MASFAEVPGCDWAIKVTNAVFVQMDEHADDLHVIRDDFLPWVSPGRTVFADGIAFTVVAASYDEALRFRHAASDTIAQQDLFLVVALLHRQDEGAEWEEIDEPVEISDGEIEAELADFAEGQPHLDEDD